MRNRLLESLQSFSKCTSTVEQQALDRLVADNSIEFALKLVNQTNQLLSKATEEIRQAHKSTDKTIDGVERLVRVAVAGFRCLHENRGRAGFKALALEKTLGNFTSLCVNARLGRQAWQGLVLLRQMLEEHAETEQDGRSSRLARSLRRLSIKTPEANMVQFPRSYHGTAMFNNLVATLLCNVLRVLAMEPDMAEQATVALAQRKDSALEWSMGDGSEALLDICFRAYSALATGEHALEVRVLALTAYAMTGKCDGRVLLRHAVNAATRHRGNDGLVVEFYQALMPEMARYMAKLPVVPELVELSRHRAAVLLHTAGISAALNACQLVVGGQAGSSALARLVAAFLSFEVLAMHFRETGETRHVAEVADDVRELAFDAVGGKARHTLNGWNSLATCADGVRRAAKAVVAAVRASGDAGLAQHVVHVLDVAGRTYQAYVSRGALAKAGADATAVHNGHAETYLVSLQLQVEFGDMDGSALQRHSDLLLMLCGKRLCSREFLRSHSTVFFNTGAAHYQQKMHARAARALEFAIQSLAMWLDKGRDDHVVKQLWKRYEVLAAAYQADSRHEEAAGALARAVAWTARRFADELAIEEAGTSVVLPPTSSCVGEAAARLVQFIEQYVRMSAGRLARDPDEPARPMAVPEHPRLVNAWMREAEAHLWRAVGVEGARRAVLEHALTEYEACSALASARCLVALATMDRDQGRDTECSQRLQTAQEVLQRQPEESMYVVGVRAECLAWQAVMQIEQGAAASKDLDECVRLWAQLASGPLDPGFLRQVSGLIQHVLDLLLARRLHSKYCSVQEVLLAMATACEGSDAEFAPIAMESLVGLGTGRMLLGDMQAAESHFQMVTGRYAPGVLPPHIEVAAHLAVAEFHIACGETEAAALALAAAQEQAVARFDELQGTKGKQQPRARPTTLLVLARAALVYSRLALSQGRLADAVELGVQGYRVLCSLLRTLAQQHATPEDDDDPFSSPAKAPADDFAFLQFNDSWALQRALVESTLYVAGLFSVRGSVKECEYFLSKGLEICARISMPLPKRLLGVRRIDVLSRRHAWEECRQLLASSEDGGEVLGIDGVRALVVLGDAWRRCGDCQHASQAYEQALEVSTGDGLAVVRDDVRVRLQLLSGAWLPDEVSVERTIDQQPEHLLMLASLRFARLQKTLAEMGLAQVLDSALFLAGATPMAEPRSEPIAQELAALDALLERASAAAIAVGSAHSVHESGHLLVLVRVVADALGTRSSSPTAAARILDNARNITVAREAAVRCHDECPPRPIVWPTEILQSPGGHEDTREIADVLPHAWVVCGLSIDRTRNLLFLTRYERGRSPAVLCLPMRALPAGLSDDPSGTVFDNAYAQMAAIIAESDQTMKVANECVSDADKLQWWQQRTDLDRRLGALLRSIEDEWLGGFRSLLLPIGAFAVGDPEAVGKAICACAESHVPMANGVALADDVCRFVAYAARDADSDDWLDVCAMLLDMFCYRGGSMCGEDGISRFAADLKLALATDHRPMDAAAPRHLVLVLDKHAQQIPWESLPCLRSHSVSRVPSLSFLQQRLSKLQRSPPMLAGPLFDTLKGEKPALSVGSPVGVRVDGSHVYYVLNPAGDLARTQQNFEAYVRASSTWTGAIGRAPMDHELAQALASESAVLYFGHGGGEQYVSRARLRALPQCSVALLLGCSSGRLRPLGEYDAAGTALDYMVAGCPALLANLWDVGDKDIDRFAKSLLAKWGLGQVGVLGGTKTPGNMSLSEAVSEARGACRMPFLTGAAPVVYGIPAYIE